VFPALTRERSDKVSEGADGQMGMSPAEASRKRSVSWNDAPTKEESIMRKSKLLVAALAASTLGALAPLPAPAAVGVYLDVAPPAPRHEVIPAPRHGYVWEPGFWDWRHGRYVWQPGYWVRERRGMYWHPSRWEYRDGRWVLERGGWHRDRWEGRRYAYRDRDHDGIPNRVDRDRDNDGVPNRWDARPNNPRVQ
jgi:hypothetical protein